MNRSEYFFFKERWGGGGGMNVCFFFHTTWYVMGGWLHTCPSVCSDRLELLAEAWSVIGMSIGD